MIAIEPKLAAEIVSRTMNIIPFNVNVMDASGTIIGSGEPSRIGELHSAAQLVIAQKRAIEVGDGAARTMAGARPGVNLPLTVRGEICGVIGLTGDPDAVRQFGELVKMSAEMILEQNLLNRELQRDTRYKEEFVLQLLSYTPEIHESLEHWAGRLDIELSQTRVAVVVRIDEQVSPDLALVSLHQSQMKLTAAFPDYLTASVSAHQLVILLPLHEASIEAALNRVFSLNGWLKRESAFHFHIAMGAILTGLRGIARSYESALAALQVAISRHVLDSPITYYDVQLPVLLSGMRSGWQAEQLRIPLQQIKRADRTETTLRRTVDMWYACNCQYSQTAKQLGIHRNTLDYRLKQIEEVTGLDLSLVDHQFLLYVALQLEAVAK